LAAALAAGLAAAFAAGLAAGFAFGDLVAGLALADFTAGLAAAGLAALAVVLTGATSLAGAAFFVAIIRGSFREELEVPVRKTCCLSLAPKRERQLETATLLIESDISYLKLTADRDSPILNLFVNCVKRNLLKQNTLSKMIFPQLIRAS
jgi:hypothetical protein